MLATMNNDQVFIRLYKAAHICDYGAPATDASRILLTISMTVLI